MIKLAIGFYLGAFGLGFVLGAVYHHFATKGSRQ